MKKFQGLIVAVAVTLGSTSIASAVPVLYYEDGTLGTSAIPGALTQLGLMGTTTQVFNTTDFNTQISSGAFDLVIVGHQFFFPTDNNIATELAAYIAGGGLALATTWQDDALPPLFQATAAGTNAPLIGNDGHPIFTGLPASIDLANPGWPVAFSRAWNPVGSAVGIGSLGAGSAAILGNEGRTILSGPLFDTYADLAEGELLMANKISFLLNQNGDPGPDPSAIPEPVTGGLAVLGMAALALTSLRRRR
ncbi:MAG: hypothetical protein JJU36_18265 [Phycisphaeraceae bacterium]|nr:hypothetical protein [Phycisphaeraceae bacterium]